MDKNLEIELRYGTQRFKSASAGLIALSKELEKKPKAVVPILRTNLHRYLTAVARAMATKHGTPYPGGTTNASLSRRSGQAVASILASPEVRGVKLSTITGAVGGVGYLNIHEDGGFLYPESGQYIAVPLPAALNANGTPKRPGPSFWANTFVFTSKKGNKLVARKIGTNLELLYVLKKQVYIRPRLGMGAAINKGMNFFIDNVIDAMAAEILDV